MTIASLRRARPIVAAVLAVAPVAACAKPAPQTATATSLTLPQFQAKHEKKLLADDTNADGRISRAEFMAAHPAGKRDPAKRFAKIDRNGDGMIDKAEIDAMLARRFKRIDANGDGVLSTQERAAARSSKGTARTEADS